MSIMYFDKKIMLYYSVSSIFSLRKKWRQAFVKSDVKPPNKLIILLAKFLISSVRYSFAFNFYAKIEWKTVPYFMRSYPIIVQIL